MSEPPASPPPSSQPSSGRERRRHPRLAATWPVSLELPEGRFEARLRDISEAGVCFHVDRPVPEMTLLQIAFELPGEVSGEAPRAAVSAEGAVVRCEPLSPHIDHYEVAVFFSKLDGDSREQLRTFVSRSTTTC